MPEVLESYLVSVGIKGQDVVLAETAKIKKSVDDVKKSFSPKDTTANFSAMGKASATNFANVRKEITARRQLEQIKRRNAATSGQRELQTIRSKEAAEKASKTEKLVGGAQSAHRAGVSAFSGAVAGSIATQLPGGLGAIFGAANNSVEAAGQQFVAGVTARKNINLIQQNYTRAFSDAFGDAFKGKTFQSREAKAFYTDLADQGVKVSTLTNADNVKTLDTFAKSQGVGSLQELVQRAQSGQLKEGAGIGKGDIALAQTGANLLNNRYTADLGYKMLLRIAERRREGIGETAGSPEMKELARSVKKDARISDREQSFQAAAEDLFAGSENPMYNNRAAQRRNQARMQTVARPVSNVGRNAESRILRLAENIRRFGPVEGYRRTLQQAQQDYQQGRGLADDEEPTDSDNQQQRQRSRQGNRILLNDTPSGAAPDLRSMSTDDVARAGSALAATLNQINNQLNAIRNQFNVRSA